MKRKMAKSKGVAKKTMNLAGPEPFKMKVKKPEPDDRPRPMSGKAGRAKRLKGVML